MLLEQSSDKNSRFYQFLGNRRIFLTVRLFLNTVFISFQSLFVIIIMCISFFVLIVLRSGVSSKAPFSLNQLIGDWKLRPSDQIKLWLIIDLQMKISGWSWQWCKNEVYQLMGKNILISGVIL